MEMRVYPPEEQEMRKTAMASLVADPMPRWIPSEEVENVIINKKSKN